MQDMNGEGSGVTVDTVGSLLAIIAFSIQGALRIFLLADKRAWGPPEFEQQSLLEETLEDAKRDFQELPALINGRVYYENDRKADSLDELHELCALFEEHAQNFKNWVRTGGPIEPEWAAKTRWLRRELHRAQCRAVRRIHDDLEASSSRPRCLGALIVRRSQQRQNPQHRRAGNSLGPTAQPDAGEVAACNSTGVFQRLGPGNRDIAFVCDFCDGFIVWEDLRSMPSTRQNNAVSTDENWAATGFTHPRHDDDDDAAPDSDIELEEAGGSLSVIEPELERTGEEKTIVFPPVAIANHLPPEPSEWQAPLLCPLCEEYFYEEQGDGDMDRVRYAQDERGFESVAKLQEHLEWTHASLIPETSRCAVL
ncbi:hypothetical protein GGS21DRAFT_115842 [Xylaria nigripes]|nr:hypothetical protein GGS21DRAFT_115842 [Xylaria nigripes]